MYNVLLYLQPIVSENNVQKSITSFSKFKYFIKQTMNYSFDGMTNFRVAPGDRSMTLILLKKSLNRLKNLPYPSDLFKIHDNNTTVYYRRTYGNRQTLSVIFLLHMISNENN